MSEDITGYKLSRQWFDFCFENPEKMRPIHTALYFFAIEHCNRLGWKKKFGFPSQMAMEAVGVKNWRTYIKAFNDLVDWGFFELIEKSKNQYSSNIIAIVKNTKAHTKALDKALQKHSQKHYKSTVGIYKQGTMNKEQGNVAPASDDSPSMVIAKDISGKLLSAIKEYDSSHRYHNSNPNIESWYEDIDKSIRIDGRTQEQLEFIIEYIFQYDGRNSAFWAGNIESGRKLREKFDTIKNQIKSEKNVQSTSKINSIVDSMYQQE